MALSPKKEGAGGSVRPGEGPATGQREGLAGRDDPPVARQLCGLTGRVNTMFIDQSTDCLLSHSVSVASLMIAGRPYISLL
ncbi:hypothetical protein XhhCFBP4925_11970 [Xanthomonas hortorum pv. hederae]|nr:hypothetical protein XhhCFBP4925_11970 [Xanthomonas hortorum pv. hederae]PUE99717.1 hypothetical protein C7T87_12335 [Xanthomonas hortorum pv. hederae]